MCTAGSSPPSLRRLVELDEVAAGVGEDGDAHWSCLHRLAKENYV